MDGGNARGRPPGPNNNSVVLTGLKRNIKVIRKFKYQATAQSPIASLLLCEKIGCLLIKICLS